jgi:hypothetical protein
MVSCSPPGELHIATYNLIHSGLAAQFPFQAALTLGKQTDPIYLWFYPVVVPNDIYLRGEQILKALNKLAFYPLPICFQ